MTNTENLSATTVEIIDALTADRDARVETHVCGNDMASLMMDDHGSGEFHRTISSREANELVRLGLVRDAR